MISKRDLHDLPAKVEKLRNDFDDLQTEVRKDVAPYPQRYISYSIRTRLKSVEDRLNALLEYLSLQASYVPPVDGKTVMIPLEVKK